MNTKAYTLIGLFMAQSFLAQGQAPQFEPVYQKYTEEKSWGVKEIGDALQAIIETPPSTDVLLTAKMLMVGHLMEAGGAAKSQEALVLADDILQSASDSWQAAIAALDKGSIYDDLGEIPQALTAAEVALVKISAIDFENLQDPLFLQYMSLSPTNDAKDLKDGARLQIAFARLDLGDTSGGNSMIENIENPEIKAQAIWMRDHRKPLPKSAP